jgi:predicted ATPase
VLRVDVSGAAAEAAVPRIGAALAARGGTLLILDNFEHLSGPGVQAVDAWRARAPEARFLLTSRERTHLDGEVLFDLGPLTVPHDDDVAGASEAVRLLVERTRLVFADYLPTAADAPALADLVRELDGLPLAIELVAGRLRVFSPTLLLECLRRQRFAVLVRDRQGAQARHDSLHRALEASWERLGAGQRAVLAQCSVFPGSFDLAAVERVVEPGPDAPWVVDTLLGLLDRSLLVRESAPPAEGARFSLLSCVRAYAEEQLRASGGAEEASARHAAYEIREGAAVADKIDAAARASAGEPSPAAALLVGADGNWFRLPSGQQVECSRRHAIRQLLLGLARHRIEAPGHPLSPEALVALGWPAEHLDRGTASLRLRVSLSTLRKMGLGGLLLNRRGGYLLDPAVFVRFQEA